MDEPQPLFDAESLRRRKLHQLAWLDNAGETANTLITAIRVQTELAVQEDAAAPTDGVRELAFGRAARALRYICAMISRIENGEPEPAPRITKHEQAFIDTRKADVAEMVEHAIAGQAESPEAVETLITRLDACIERERPERFAHLSLGQMVQTVCRDLEMKEPRWEDWQDEPWAREEILTQPEGSPYAGYPRGQLRLDRAKRRQAARHEAAREHDPEDAYELEPDEPPMTRDEWMQEFSPPETYAEWRAKEDEREAAEAAAKAAKDEDTS